MTIQSQPIQETQSKDPLIFREHVFESDVEAVRRITNSSGFFSKEEVMLATDLIRERLEKGIVSGYHFVFAERDGDTVGYTCYGPIPCTQSSHDLYWIAVDEAARAHGVGRALLEETEGNIEARGGKRIYAETSSRRQYQPTRDFYLRCGYQQAALLEDFYAPGDGKVIFVKVL